MELAARIKTIKEDQRVEAAPVRARQNHSSAEEPIAARIRRRASMATRSMHMAHETPQEITEQIPGAVTVPSWQGAEQDRLVRNFVDHVGHR